MGKTQEYFAHDDADKDRILSQLEGKGKPSLSRYKGLAEMPSATLKKTTMDPATRTLLKVTLKDAKATDEAFSNLMGKDASLRYQFIKENSEAFINKGGELDL